LGKLMRSLRKGDVVLVCKLGRLGRSTRELLDLIHRTDQAGASFKSLGDPLFDTSSSQGRLLVTMLAAVAEFERELIRERTGEGRKRAEAMVSALAGRSRSPSINAKKPTAAERTAKLTRILAASYGVSVSTISRLRGTP
jgi:DNA invertase Pin-like site-specific DNA recombinase